MGEQPSKCPGTLANRERGDSRRSELRAPPLGEELRDVDVQRPCDAFEPAQCRRLHAAEHAPEMTARDARPIRQVRQGDPALFRDATDVRREPLVQLVHGLERPYPGAS